MQVKKKALFCVFCGHEFGNFGLMRLAESTFLNSHSPKITEFVKVATSSARLIEILCACRDLQLSLACNTSSLDFVVDPFISVFSCTLCPIMDCAKKNCSQT